MIFGIVGLGLIGGSLARSIKFHSDHTVYGADINETALLQARMVNAIDEQLTEENLGECDVTLIASWGAIPWRAGSAAAFPSPRTICLKTLR